MVLAMAVPCACSTEVCSGAGTGASFTLLSGALAAGTGASTDTFLPVLDGLGAGPCVAVTPAPSIKVIGT